ncbi:MAG: AAA-associated domain-containing protein, partial [Caldilinea sp.]
SENHCLTWDVVHIALELEFPPGEAQHQLDTIVDWGRYAEVLAYDDSRALITLEPEGLLHLPPAEKPS